MSHEGVLRTEAIDPATQGLDQMETVQLVRTLVDTNQRAVGAVHAACAEIARAADAIVERLAHRGGRLHYIGAGTSGRIGVLDAAELPPTFGVPSDLVVAHIAGGTDAILTAVEGAEDDPEAGMRILESPYLVTERDAVVGISASGGAQFVVAAILGAREGGAATIAITSVADGMLASAAEIAIVLDTGAEPIAGSTRLGAGTAQKIALNALSTAVMVRLGKVYDNLMVDVVATNAKLRKRALTLVGILARVDGPAAQALLDAAGGSVKLAVVMARRSVDANAARSLLAKADGRLRSIIG
jgi:N-acetylmuramic acid 6-phosphate etherase